MLRCLLPVALAILLFVALAVALMTSPSQAFGVLGGG
jgi:hypothetical protein